jgi:hypothetical protein
VTAVFGLSRPIAFCGADEVFLLVGAQPGCHQPLVLADITAREGGSGEAGRQQCVGWPAAYRFRA